MRRGLEVETAHLYNLTTILDRINEVTVKENDVLNLAPGFFYSIFYSFGTTIVLIVYRLVLDERSDVLNLRDYFEFVDQNPDLFKAADIDDCELKKMVENDYKFIEENKDVLDNFRAVRHKGLAHKDIAYFGDPLKIKIDFPINREDADRVYGWIGESINRYSKAYDGVYTDFLPPDADDVDFIIELIRNEIKKSS